MYKKLCEGIVLLLSFVLIFAEFFHPISSLINPNPDLVRHIKLGEIILTQKIIPTTNMLSYTHPTFPYIDNTWFSEVIFYMVYQLYTFEGMIILHTIVILASFTVLILGAYRKVSIASVGFLIFLSAVILTGRPDIRPEIFSFFFLSVIIAILYKNREKFTNWIFLLPLIQLLWINMHLYFILGLIIMVIFVIDHVINKNNQFELRNRFTRDKSTKYLLLVLFVSLVLSLLNPHGITGLLYPFQVFNNYGFSVEENRNIFYNPYPFFRVNILFFWLWVIFLFSTFAINRKKVSLASWLIAFIFTFAAIYYLRLVPLIIFATFIPLAQSLTSIGKEYFSNKRLSKHIFIPIIMLLGIGIYTIVPIRGFGLGVNDQGDSVIKFVEQNAIKGPIFNDFDIGNYLDFRLYPKERVFVDARPEAYPADFFSNTYIPMLNDPAVFSTVSKRYDFNTVIIYHQNKTSDIAIFLKQFVNNPEWKMVYLDDVAVVFVRNIEKNKFIISSFAMDRQNIHITDYAQLDIEGLTRLGSLFNKVGWLDLEESIYNSILIKNTSYCPAIGRIIEINIEKNKPFQEYQGYIVKFNSICR